MEEDVSWSKQLPRGPCSLEDVCTGDARLHRGGLKPLQQKQLLKAPEHQYASYATSARLQDVTSACCHGSPDRAVRAHWALGTSQAQAVRVRLSLSVLVCYRRCIKAHKLASIIVEMQELPDDILLQVARLVLKKEEGLRLWCELSSACKRLWRFQLPSEPTYLLDDRLPDQGESFS